MGIYKLTQFVHKHVPLSGGSDTDEPKQPSWRNPHKPPAPQVVLLVDFSSFMYALSETICKTLAGEINPSIKDESIKEIANALKQIANKRANIMLAMGPDPFSVKVYVEALLQLYKRFGIKLIFIADSKVDQFTVKKALEHPQAETFFKTLLRAKQNRAAKKLCREMRSKEVKETIKAMRGILGTKEHVQSTQQRTKSDSLPRRGKPLKIDYALFSLVEAIISQHSNEDVVLVRSLEEADPVLAQEAVSLPSFTGSVGNVRRIIMSDDSDFFIVPGVEIVPCVNRGKGTLGVYFSHFAARKPDMCTESSILTLKSTAIAAALGLPPSALPGFAALIGSDYTKDAFKVMGVWEVDPSTGTTTVSQSLAQEAGIDIEYKSSGARGEKGPPILEIAAWIRRACKQQNVSLKRFNPLRLHKIQKLLKLLNERYPKYMSGDILRAGIERTVEGIPILPNSPGEARALTVYEQQLEALVAYALYNSWKMMQIGALCYRGVLSSSLLYMISDDEAWYKYGPKCYEPGKPTFPYNPSFKVYHTWVTTLFNFPNDETLEKVQAKLLEAAAEFLKDTPLLQSTASVDDDFASSQFPTEGFHVYKFHYKAPLLAVVASIVGVEAFTEGFSINDIATPEPAQGDPEAATMQGLEGSTQSSSLNGTSGDTLRTSTVKDKDICTGEGKGEDEGDRTQLAEGIQDKKEVAASLFDVMRRSAHPCIAEVDFYPLMKDAGLLEVERDVLMRFRLAQSACDQVVTKNVTRLASVDTSSGVETKDDAGFCDESSPGSRFNAFVQCCLAADLLWDRTWSLHAPQWGEDLSDEPEQNISTLPSSHFFHHFSGPPSELAAQLIKKLFEPLSLAHLKSAADKTFETSGLVVGLLGLRHMLSVRAGMIADAIGFARQPFSSSSSHVGFDHPNFDFRLMPLCPSTMYFMSRHECKCLVVMLTLLAFDARSVEKFRSYHSLPSIAVTSSMTEYTSVVRTLLVFGLSMRHYTARDSPRSAFQAITTTTTTAPTPCEWLDMPLYCALCEATSLADCVVAVVGSDKQRFILDLADALFKALMSTVFDFPNGRWLIEEVSTTEEAPSAMDAQRKAEGMLFRVDPEPSSGEQKEETKEGGVATGGDKRPWECDATVGELLVRGSFPKGSTAGLEVWIQNFHDQQRNQGWRAWRK